MKNIFLIGIVFSLVSCSGSSEQNNLYSKDSSSFVGNNNQLTQADTLTIKPTKELQQTIDSAIATGYIQNTKTVIHENRFGLIDPHGVFGPEQEAILQSGYRCHVELAKGNALVRIDEFVFTTNQNAAKINQALTSPVLDKTKPRFFSYPLTFFPFQNRIYYISVAEEKNRTELNEINSILVCFLSPEG